MQIPKLKDVDINFLATLPELDIKPTLGGDPEFFIADKENKTLASDKFFPSKQKPILITSCGSLSTRENPNKIFFDGIQAEIAVGFNRCREYVAANVARCMRVIEQKIGKENHIVLQPAVRVQKSVIDDADPEAKIFGCEPDFNAYTLTTNTAEMDATKHPFRYAGGHIHIGTSSPYLKQGSKEYEMAKTEEGHIRIIKLLDLFVGVPSVLLDTGVGSKQRRLKYGKAGCFRPTPYGIEYRTLSCWWLKSPITLSLVYGLAKIAWALSLDEKADIIKKHIKYDEEQIRGIIDSGDRKEALKIWQMIRPYILVFGRPYGNPLHINGLSSTSYNGTKLYNIHDEMAKNTRISQINKIIKRGKMPESTKGHINVFGIAAFEYMIKTGVDHVITDNIFKEWSQVINSSGDMTYNNGFMSCIFNKLGSNKDFASFQESLYKTL